MATRYCIEVDEKAAYIVIHDQKCDDYSHGTLLAEGRVVDIGQHGDAIRALHSVRDDFPDATICRECCRFTLLQKVG